MDIGRELRVVVIDEEELNPARVEVEETPQPVEAAADSGHIALGG